MTYQEVASSGQHQLDIWHVRLASGETRPLSLEELDEAFNAGVIDAKTPVLKAGALQWSTLGQVAGLDTTPPPVSAVPNSIAPVALDAAYGEIDLSNLRGAGFSDVATNLGGNLADLSADASDVRALRPRRGKTIIGALVAVTMVAGLGFAAFRAKPALERAQAASSLQRAPVTVVEPAAPKPVDRPPVAATPAPPPEPAAAQPEAPVVNANDAVPTMSAASLPNAPPSKAKKAAPKRRK